MTTTDTEPTRWRKKPVEIEAVQFTGHNYDRIASWMGAAATTMISPDGTLDLHIETLEGTLHVSPDDWVIRGVQGEFYPCKPDIFEQTYEPAEPHPVARVELFTDTTAKN